MARRKPWIVGAVALGVVLGAVGLYLFQPWKLWTDETVNEALPSSQPAPDQTQPEPEKKEDEDDAPEQAPAGPVTLASGAFITHEHATSGTAKIVELADGSRVLRLEGLDTSNGPDLKVWVTDAEVLPGRDGWGVFDDGAYLDLGQLKGNKGSHNYALPSDADLETYTSVSIWCDRFNVSFGAAELARA
ncbi:DM13 domain-containing protein [Streptomyces sp. JJ66]|uniref:DM13 domain-containing protein n=1 Tax=Streptomyces sp. JJ66 TaxID=2803843 RepID=UPI001C584FD0|nr:DM13 domain-containing protein [Streptomyces sp. JJ66]MBW1604496.1 DM13 domain-containing protein [Streptomyces sp. JJ66]